VVLPNKDIVSISLDYTMKLWNSTTGSVKKTIQQGSTNYFRQLSIFSNGDIVTANNDAVYIFDSNLTLKSNKSNLLYVSALFGLSGNFIAGYFANIKIYDAANISEVKSILTSATNKVLLVFQNGDIASAGFDNFISIWYSNGASRMNLTGHSSGINALTKLPNGDLVSGSADKTIKVWDLNTGLVKKNLTGNLNPITALIALSNDFVVSGSCNEPIKIWDLNTKLSKP